MLKDLAVPEGMPGPVIVDRREAKEGRIMPRKAKKKVQRELPGIRETPRQKLIRLIKEYRKKTAIGAAIYKQADDLLEQIRDNLACNKRIPLGDGLYAVLVDRFEEQSKIWQPVAMKRWELQIQDAGGAVVRMRDRTAKR